MASSSSKSSLVGHSRFLSLGASVSYLVFHSVINQYQLLFAKKRPNATCLGTKALRWAKSRSQQLDTTGLCPHTGESQ